MTCAWRKVCQPPPVLATFEPSDSVRAFDSWQPPERDLFIKPRFGRSNSAVDRINWNGVDFLTNRGDVISPPDLSTYLTGRARHRNRTLLVQPRLSNHPQFGNEPQEALATIRLVTGRFGSGDVVPIFGFIYVAKSGAITSRHGSVALIEVATGRPRSTPPAESTGIKHWNYWINPVFQENDALPDWDAALGYVKAAHQACPNFAFIGWDLALSAEGPVLLEGNANWNADEYQSLSGKPLGLTIFAQILEDRIR